MNKRNHLHQSASTIIFSKLLLFCYLQSLQKYLAYTYSRAGAVSDYSYTNSSGSTQTMDLAITGSVFGKPVYVVDITDPTKPRTIGTVKDMQGNIVTGIVAVDFAISKQAKLAYISATTGLYVIDIKDPTKPVLLNIVGNETYTDGSTVSLGNLRGIVEQDGWVYLANLQNGMSVVNLGAYKVNVVNNKGVNVVEVQYSDGTDEEKQCMIKIKMQDAETYCNDKNMQGMISVKTRTSDGNTEKVIDVPADITYPAKYDLSFTPESDTVCIAKVKTATGVKAKIIMSNMPADKIENLGEAAPTYGGLLPAKLVVEIQFKDDSGHSLANVTEKVNLQGTQIIVLAIDGLRQDVLYSSQYQSPTYTDNTGCGGQSCFTPLAVLPGLSQILDVTGSNFVMIPDVTAIFPSVTLASWASIFTGKMPKDTGITGNEFYARNLIFGVPSMFFQPPPGMVTFDGGAFPGYSECGKMDKAMSKYYIVPYREKWTDIADPMDIQQNYVLRDTAPTIFETLTKDPLYKNVQDYYGKNDAVVVAYSHYARGASRWLTHGIIIPPDNPFNAEGESKILDKASWERLDDYLGDATDNGNYLTEIIPGIPLLKKRNKTPFSALTVWYLPGLDHMAHGAGMGEYKRYLKDTTDDYIKKFVKWLKDYKEFNNKIFIIVADHGTTAMPENLTYKDENWLGLEKPYPAETSCNLKLDFAGDPDKPDDMTSAQLAELANNNLHIWELGNLFSALGTLKDAQIRTNYKLLVPTEIEATFVDTDVPEIFKPTSNKTNADVIAALNGPMAHIYSMIGTDQKTITEMAEVFRVMLSDEYLSEAKAWFGFKNSKSYDDFQVKHVGRLWNSVDKILVRITGINGGEYQVFNGLDAPLTSVAGLTGENYVRALDRITGLNDPNRSGDIILIMRDDMIYPITESIEDHRYTCGVACKSWHGSLNPSDSYVPLIVAYPGGTKSTIETLLKRENVCKENYSGCTGNWKLPEIIKEIVKEQYK